MENRDYNKDFEQFVKQNADQYRMFPSEKVWQGIHSSLHSRRRWYGIGLAVLLLTTGAAVTWVMLSYSSRSEKVATASPKVQANKQSISIQSADVSETAEASSPNPATISYPAYQGAAVTIPASSEKFDLKSIETEVVGHDSEFKALPQPGAAASFLNEPITENQKAEVESSTPLNIVISDQATDNTMPMSELSVPVFLSDRSITDNSFELPQTIESVVNSYKYRSHRKHLTWEAYFVPTISYRTLTENTAFLRSAQSNNSPYSYAALHDINSVVIHKPDMGLEFGFTTGYPISKALMLTGGLQFNVSKYDIRAYNYTSEVATIALSSGPGSNSVSMVTNYRSFGGYNSDWLHNLYLSVSAPIGAELKLSGHRKSYYGVSGSLQPTYILRDRAYLISTDYKNYAEVPSLIRKWNMNSSFEIFAGYNTGKVKWKVGPQVRYQMLSSFEEKYPVREHLFDFGLKIGIMLSQ